jgi:hypothetical protein
MTCPAATIAACGMKTASGMLTAWPEGRPASALQITRFRAGRRFACAPMPGRASRRLLAEPAPRLAVAIRYGDRGAGGRAGTLVR